MSITHTAMAIYKYTRLSAVTFLSNLGGDISYTFFLFSFGAGLFYSISKPIKLKYKKYLNKALIWLITYYLLSIIGYIVFTYDATNAIDLSITTLINIFLLKTPIPLVDFFISFVIFLLLTVTFKKAILITISNYILIIMLIFVFNLISFFARETVDTNTIGSLFWGYKNYSYFPILNYSLVFLLGLNYSFVKTYKSKSKYMILAMFSLFVPLEIYLYKKFDYSRFPPNTQFILYGLSILYCILAIINFIPANKIPQKVKNGITAVGKNIFKFYITHTLIIFLLYALPIEKTSDPLIIFSIWIGTIAISFAFIYRKLILTSLKLIFIKDNK